MHFAPLLGLAAVSLASSLGRQETFHAAPISNQPSKVNVTLYVMSRCPDARLCEGVFEEVFQAEGMYDKVDLRMNYIGTLNHSDPLGVTCKHGQLECIGNAHQLCLRKHLPLPTFYAALACQNFHDFPGDIGKVAFTKQCVETAKVDWWASGLGKCIEGKKSKKKGGDDGLLGKEAHKLLLSNVADTVDKGVSTSCTVEIASSLLSAGKRTCVVDGGIWKSCDDGHTAADFIRVIEDEWDNLRSRRS